VTIVTIHYQDSPFWLEIFSKIATPVTIQTNLDTQHAISGKTPIYQLERFRNNEGAHEAETLVE